MTIDQAIINLLQSGEFKQAAKTNATLRSIASRYNNGTLKSGAKVEVLLQFGYEITARKIVRKKK